MVYLLQNKWGSLNIPDERNDRSVLKQIDNSNFLKFFYNIVKFLSRENIQSVEMVQNPTADQVPEAEQATKF